MNKLLALAITIIIVASCIGLADAHSRRSIVVLAKTETGRLWYNYLDHALYWQATITDTVHVENNRNHTFCYYSQGINSDSEYGDRADYGIAQLDQWGGGYLWMGAIGTLKIDVSTAGPLRIPDTQPPTNWILKLKAYGTVYWRFDWGTWHSYTPHY